MADRERQASPDLFDVVGQDRAAAWLYRGLARGQLHHGLLLAGPAGVGRRTTAEALAMTLLCGDPRRQPNGGRFADLPDDLELPRPCRQCEACRLVAAGSHPDLHPVYKELARYHEDPGVRGRVMQELGIPVIRQFLIAPANGAAAMGRGKVFIVREAELLSDAAQNALLKTLEEPPPDVTIVLLAQRAEQLLPTTRSRCALLRFGPLPGDFVAEKLAAAGVPEPEARFWAAFTDGSVGRALRLAGQEMHPIKRDIVQRVGALDRAGDAELGEHLHKTAETLARNAVKAAGAEGGAELSMNLANRQAVAVMLQILSAAFRDALTVATGADRPIVNADQAEAVKSIAGRLGAEAIADALEQLAEYERLLWRNANAKIIWDNAVITCASAPPLGV